VGGRSLIITNTNFRANKSGLGMRETAERDGTRGDREGGKVLLGELDEFTVVNATSTNEHHAVSGVVGLDIRGQVFTTYRKDVPFGAKDCTTERLT